MKLKSEIYIAGRRIADDTPIYIIGEMACGHQGDLKQALRLIDSAVNAQADCIQIQIFDTAANMAPSSPIYSLLEELYFTPTEWQEIMDYARQFDIHVSVFAYDEPSLALALELKPDMLKLNSSELSNPPMLIGAAQSGLPFTLGTGASSLTEIRHAVTEVLNHGGDKLILMHGVQNFPTDINAANVKKIRHLKNEFGGLVIFADHTDAREEIAQWIDLLAIGQGAALLEKHLILDRTRQGVDWQAALEPAEFKRYVSTMRLGSESLGSYDFQAFTESDLQYRRFQKKFLVAAKELKAGDKLTLEDVSFLRVQAEHEGIAPNMFADVAEGKRIARDIKQYEQIMPTDLLSNTKQK